MNPIPSPNPMLPEAEVRSNPRLDPRVSAKSQSSSLEICRSKPDIQKTRLSELLSKRNRDARVMFNADAAPPAQSYHRQAEQAAPPLRLALARRSVKNQIFAYMDHGDKKTEIESRTGLSHRCIKWHKQMWRAEGRRPRTRVRKVSVSSMRTPRSPSRRNEQSSRKRPAGNGKGDSSAVSKPRGSRRQRKHRAVREGKGRSACTPMEMSRSGQQRCTDNEIRGSSHFLGEVSMQEKDEVMSTSGALTTLPIRNLVS